MKINLQAREIVRAAKRHGIKLVRGGTSRNRACARGVVAFVTTGSVWNMYDGDLHEKVGRSHLDLEALEVGFEYGCSQYLSISKHHNNRYFKVGQRVAELAGL